MRNKLVIIYDYDGTLAPGSIQEPMLIPLIMPEAKENPQLFWELPNQLARSDALDGNLMYMNEIIRKAQQQKIPLTREFLRQCGSYSQNFKGVDTWFTRINTYAETRGIIVEHYIISSGNKELLIGTKIAKYFTDIAACQFFFNDEGEAIGVGQTVDEHMKTKFIQDIRTPHHERADLSPDERSLLPYSQMVYIGDGFTDVPAMKTILRQGGLAFAVYSDERGLTRCRQFQEKQLINNYFNTGSCYKRNSALEKTIFREIDRIAAQINEDDDNRQLTIFDFIS